jgi:hypothetical protein
VVHVIDVLFFALFFTEQSVRYCTKYICVLAVGIFPFLVSTQSYRYNNSRLQTVPPCVLLLYSFLTCAVNVFHHILILNRCID